MMFDGTLTTGRILDIFTEEVQTRQGRVTDTYHDGRRLFVRSLLPHVADARPNDSMQGGLALRATEDELSLHPYLFRQVCRNGAIMAQAIESLHVECLGVYSADEGTAMLREAIANCSQQRVFAKSLRGVQSLAMAEIDQLLNLIPYLSHFQQGGMEHFLAEILERYSLERDHTQFGFMNAITSVARDTHDPDDRWRLEELGGGMAARLRPKRPSDAPGRQNAEREFVFTS
jgi:hypothetical protein